MRLNHADDLHELVRPVRCKLHVHGKLRLQTSMEELRVRQGVVRTEKHESGQPAVPSLQCPAVSVTASLRPTCASASLWMLCQVVEQRNQQVVHMALSATSGPLQRAGPGRAGWRIVVVDL